MAHPHISAREYIRWPPTAAYENTNTLVVTSPEGRFVDIRMRIMHPETAASLPKGIQPGDALEWAFGGLSSTAITHEPKTGRQVFRGTWKHLVDSRCSNAEAEKFHDSGEITSLEAGKSLEKGTMVNPYHKEAGEQAYEECWAEVKIQSQRKDGRLEFVVLQLMDEDVEVRGVVVRVGHVCQGIVRIGEEFSVERWMWRVQEGWKREVKIGSAFLPTGLAMEEGKVELGDEVKRDGAAWKVVELGITEN